MSKSYRVGAFAVASDNWPQSWHQYASQQYPREDIEGGHKLTLSIQKNAPHQVQWKLGAAQRLQITRTDHGYLFLVEDAFRAIYTKAPGEEAHIEIESVSMVLGPHFTLCNILRAVSSVAYALDYDGLMLHAGCGIFHDRGVVFCGRSGAGKTTISLGMRETTYISDDITLLTNISQSISTAPLLVGSPFYGSRGVGGAQIDSPLAAIGILGQSLEGTDISPFPPDDLVPELLRHVVCFTNDPKVVSANMARVIALADKVFVARVMRDLRDSADTVVNTLLTLRDRTIDADGQPS